MREGSPNFEQLAQEEAEKKAEAEKTQETTALHDLTPEEIDASISKLEENENPLAEASDEELKEGLKNLE